MYRRLFACALLIFPGMASADLLIMKDGTQLRGTFSSANSTRMSFTELNGNRRDVNLNDIRELRFGGDEASQPQRDGTGNNPGSRGQQESAFQMGDELDQLRQDLSAAMDNNDLTPTQRQTLDDARDTLRSASQQTRNGRPVNQRNVRLALDSIRNGADRMQRQDRDRLNDDIRRLSAFMGGQRGRDY